MINHLRRDVKTNSSQVQFLVSVNTRNYEEYSRSLPARNILRSDQSDSESVTLAPPDLSLPSRNITALSYSFTT